MKSKLAAILFALLFGFGAGGAFGISSLVNPLYGWWEARSWEPTQATVIDAELKVSSDETTTYQATARYRYDIGGEVYEGARVGLSRGSDNVGDWQREHYADLESAKRTGRSITIWVDPTRPERSVIDRDIRWSIVAFSIPFATLFPLVSIAALWFLAYAVRTPAAEFAKGPKLKDNLGKIPSDARYGVYGIWAFATFWNLVSFPLAFVLVPREFGHSWWWLAVLLFPLVGVTLISVAIRKTMLLMRHGEVFITLNPTQPRLGESFSIRAQFSREPPAGQYEVSLLCEQVDSRGEDTTHKVIWRQDRMMQSFGIDLACTFTAPSELPASQPATGRYSRWRIQIMLPDGKDKRDFDVVIRNAAEVESAATGAERAA